VDGPGGVERWTTDVTREDFYTRVEALPRLDVLVNNAGTNAPQPFVEVDPDTLGRLIELNVRAAFRTAQSAARVMRRTGGGGAIVHMSSQMGHVGSPNRTVYCMTKHAIEGLAKAMAVELAPHGIRVNTVAPTFVETPMTAPMFADAEFRRFVLDQIPLGRLATVEEVAAAVLYLVSPGAAMVTGHSLRVDGGWTAR
jgi:NAD(P)-dependent dehydrogenase (short-subunit alcohol dehydrogenase family)